MTRFFMLVTVVIGWGYTPLPAAPPSASERDWPQFRGPLGAAAPADQAKLPVDFGPDRNVLWKTDVPSGNSSPCVCKDRIFLTAFDKTKQLLETICLDRGTGRILWRQPAPPVAKIETSLHPTNGPATPTPTADGEAVYVYFGSYGLLAYDFDGKEKWHKPLPSPEGDFGSGTSPVLAGDLLLLTCQGKEACLLAVNRQTGETAWKGKVRYGASYSTPLLRQADSTTEVILAQRRGVVAYDLKDGAERWWVGGVMGNAIPSLASGEGLLFAVASMIGTDPDDRLKFPSFDELLKKFDADKDGQLGQKEVPADLTFYNRGSTDPKDNIVMDDMFGFIDKNQDGKLSRKEWDEAEQRWAKMESALIAFHPGGKGELRQDQAVVWKEKRALPEVPSPLYYQGRLYLVKDGGLASCFDASTGKLLYRQRLGANSFFYASPVAGDGKIYAASFKGVIVVFAAGPTFKVLARNQLGEAIVATPALVDGRVYVRTEGHLYAFGE